mmetsp:Transcript_40188/g.93410  ORF Transcript_40188/g.93410 Transcript_40188/m.93410 type:complete len:200 (+) Transcript_40188:59-658(+)|eukprot:CAMPEP_0171091498 /NCGR_PEP_ID=MMETSP0766_2-20121228/33651_1 /TAXON_ID=439317 /ORGANISM="Gambierdiscus australes, Strain CAWD 149" /LENGTH=199 /DNA_ID=CAMNT_0011549609 /DNA_START=54 /DNA_END=653 /DNA_ORIENTATION=+
MASMRDRCVDWAITASSHGGSWWMPVFLLIICTVNSLTGGVLIWSVGVLQLAIFSIVVLSRKYTWFLGPVCLCIGSLIAAVTYIRLMRSNGADALLEMSGAKNSAWLTKTQDYANDYGVLGLLGLQIAPVPIPTAIIVVTGMLAKINEFKIISVICASKFIQLMISAAVMKYATENKTAEEYIREQFKGEAPSNETKRD